MTIASIAADLVVTATFATVPTTPVTFEVVHTPAPGHAVFVLGDRPELGGNDTRRAVKLTTTNRTAWSIDIALPTGADYTYEFITRDETAGQWGNAANGTPVTTPVSSTTPGQPIDQASVLISTTFTTPVVKHARQFQPFNTTPMTDIGPGRNPGERLFLATDLGDPTVLQQFFIEDTAGTGRAPSAGTLGLAAPVVFVHDDQAFTYLPDNAPIGPAQRVDDPPGSLSIFSNTLGEQRTYRVLLPRGYDQHTDKRYPVLYMHDGQNVFDQGTFGSWNVDTTAARQQTLGLARETIIVAADHGPDRTGDYLTPFEGFNADDYAAFLFTELKPLIDANYRTLSDADNTAIAGSSFGGVVSMYLSYEFADTARRAAVFSPSVWAMPTFLAHIAATPNPDLRLYLDSGDAGSSNDGFDGAIELRDTLAANTTNHFALESQLRHVVGFGQAHNETAWAARFPNAYAWLFPPTEEPDAGLRDLLTPNGCNRADIAEPFGVFDLADIDFFIRAFSDQDPAADFAPTFGIFDLADIDAFITEFLAGCP